MAEDDHSYSHQMGRGDAPLYLKELNDLNYPMQKLFEPYSSVSPEKVLLNMHLFVCLPTILHENLALTA